MTSAKHTIELHAQDRAFVVEFIRDTDGKWHAQVTLTDGTQWAFRQDTFGPFHPCDQHAERLVWVAIGMVNSARVA